MNTRMLFLVCIALICFATPARADDAEDLTDRDPSVRAKAAEALGKG